MKSYRVREKKQTDCVLSNERYETTKNDKIILKCTCVSCGATKIKFMDDGIIDKILEQGSPFKR